jgi:primosomal protein N' (replication factor Y) (superfamily II helicase)
MTNPNKSDVWIAKVAVDVPLPGLFDYWIPTEILSAVGANSASKPVNIIGLRVVVPWGNQQRVGVVFDVSQQADSETSKIKPISLVISDMAPLCGSWLKLIQFAADYYHRGVGEIALPALPKQLRVIPSPRQKTLAKRRLPAGSKASKKPASALRSIKASRPALTASQHQALGQLLSTSGFVTHVLHGITGSGKTEVYLQWFEQILADPLAQVMLLVPEIGLTPQLTQAVAERFESEEIAVLHSGLTDAKRAQYWLAAVEGRARIVVGTRLAVLTPLANLRAIVIDEEHDSSYRQTEGVHYSARDLAIATASQQNIPILLGSATPALETWHAVSRQRYQYMALRERATGAALPTIQIVNVRHESMKHGLSSVALKNIAKTLAAGQQVLIYLNRRGYSPVLHCAACGWLSACDACSAYRVLHRVPSARPSSAYRLICHHCASDQTVPKRCPDCGAVDLAGMGRGTQKLEESLLELFANARIARIDRDVGRKAGATAKIIAATHEGEVDILIGTQMLAKGHDFQRLALVVVLDADQGLFASDFRAPERLFSNLMQVSGRAGRAVSDARVVVQTRYPDHPLFDALTRHDYDYFANQQLHEREQAELPPWVFHALLKAQSKNAQAVIDLLTKARELATQLCETNGWAAIRLYQPVPMPMAKVAHQERAQLLIESGSRKQLHQLLALWSEQLRAVKSPARWQLEVDPLEI